jgi:hypothetical protein
LAVKLISSFFQVEYRMVRNTEKTGINILVGQDKTGILPGHATDIALAAVFKQEGIFAPLYRTKP